jgi:hypothetical protein
VAAIFSAPVQTDPKAHPASYTVGTAVPYQREKRTGRTVNHPPPSSAEVKERVDLYLYSPSGSSWPVIGRTLPFTVELVNAHNQGTRVEAAGRGKDKPSPTAQTGS